MIKELLDLFRHTKDGIFRLDGPLVMTWCGIAIDYISLDMGNEIHIWIGHPIDDYDAIELLFEKDEKEQIADDRLNGLQKFVKYCNVLSCTATLSPAPSNS